MLRPCHFPMTPCGILRKLHNYFLCRLARISTAYAFDFALRCARMLLTLSGELFQCHLLLP